MNKIASYINHHIVGNVFSSSRILDRYSTDRSILKIRPKVVAVPDNANDIRKLVRFSNQLATKDCHLPVTVRGSGMDKTGASIGSGILISMENMNKIQEIDARQKLVRLQTGVTLGQLNSALALHGLTIPIAGNPRETIGGLIANYRAGDLSSKYGDISKYVTQAEVVLSSGDIVQTDRLSKRALSRKKGTSGFEGTIYRELDNLISDNTDVIKETLRPSHIDSGGYQMIARVKRQNGSFDLLPLFYASQGTLGIVTEVIMTCELITQPPTYVAAEFTDYTDAISFAKYAKALIPCEVNVYDIGILEAAKAFGKTLNLFRKPFESGLLVLVGFDDAKKRRRDKKIRRLKKTLQKASHVTVSTPATYNNIRSIHSTVVSYLNDFHAERPPLVDDTYISSDRLAEFFEAVTQLGEQNKTRVHIYGSLSANNYHVRPELDLATVAGRQLAACFLRDYAKIVRSLNGSLTGGSPEGRTKAIVTVDHIDSRLLTLYGQLKKALDPNGIMNPGVKIEVNIRSTVREFRTSPNLGITTE